MGLNLQFPVPTDRMGAMVAACGIRNSAIVEFGPMGTANYFERTLGSLGLREEQPHYAVHTTDTDLALGACEKLSQAIRAVEEAHNPDLIFVFASSVMQVIGVDVEGILREQSQGIRTPVVTFSGGSFGSPAARGIRDFLLKLMSFVKPPERIEPMTYNILGLLPDDFHFRSDCNALQGLMERYFSARCLCTFPYDCSLEGLNQLPRARLNLVLRREALDSAILLQEKYGTPYVYARPYGPTQVERLCSEIRKATDWDLNLKLLQQDCRSSRRILSEASLLWRRDRMGSFDRSVLLFGNCSAVEGIAEFLREELGLTVYPRTDFPGNSHIPLWDAAEWETLAAQHPGAVILGDGASHVRYGNRAAVISHPALGRRDLTGRQPFLGLSGGENLAQLIDDCRCL